MTSQTSSYDVIVIGAGVEGSASAYTLATEGRRVLLIEQFPLPHSRGSSGGYSRITRYTYSKEFYVNMMMDCFPLWDQLARKAGSELFVNCGTLDLRMLGSQDLAKLTGVLRKFNITHEVLQREEVAKRFPMLTLGEGEGAVWDPRGGILRADKCVAAFQKLFKELGGVIHDGEPVTSVVPGDNVTVATTKSVYKAPRVVIATGPWTGKFAASLGVDLHLQPLRINVLYFSAIPGKESEHTQDKMPCVVDTRSGGDPNHIYALPQDEFPGLVKVCLHVGPKISPDERDGVDSQWVRDNVRGFNKGLFPWLRNDKPSFEDGCIYTMTPDRNAYIDRHPKYPNIVFAAGFSGQGFKLAPAVGRAVTEMVLGKPFSYDMAPFKIDRFSPPASL